MKKSMLTGTPLLFLALVFSSLSAFSQQLPDTAFTFQPGYSAYQPEKGPIVFIDQAHNNFHTKDGGFSPFSKLIELDGYRVSGLTKPVSNSDILTNCKILVIANALNKTNIDNWVLPTPSAFTREEIQVIRKWVKRGGRLLLIADHMPFAGAAYDLGKAFGYEFINGFAISDRQTWPPTVFSIKDNTLKRSSVTAGMKESEKIDSVATFTGSAFRSPKKSTPVLCFPSDYKALQPDTAWKFDEKTPQQPIGGLCQGSILKYGKGRVAVFGEAAMFTAQVVNGNFKVGINSEAAPQNAQFVLNLLHWLDGKE